MLEGQVNLDDLLISRPGGIVRQRVSGAVEPIVTPPIGQEAYQMMKDSGVRHLLVTQNKVVVGLVSIRDILANLQES